MNRRLQELERHASMLPHGEDISFPAEEIGDPRRNGYKLSLGIPVWAAHFRKTLSRDNAMHLKIFGSEGHLHREHVNPHDNLLEHLKQDVKVGHWQALGLSVLGLAAAVKVLARLRR